ncbi:MAG: MerR family transcriptional regulator [Candidatus Latescibacteria bacterium]|nr:MerR family transcriptional regulator [Candidatus Latescibacterota bacterium]
MKRVLGTKLYYSISEVASITDLPAHTLRAWEREFPWLKPRRVSGKNRAFRPRDIGVVLLLKNLLQEQGFTTKGVHQKLRQEPDLLQRTPTLFERHQQGGPADLGEGETALESVAKVDTQSPISGLADHQQREKIRQILDGARRELHEILVLLEGHSHNGDSNGSILASNSMPIQNRQAAGDLA